MEAYGRWLSDEIEHIRDGLAWDLDSDRKHAVRQLHRFESARNVLEEFLEFGEATPMTDDAELEALSLPLACGAIGRSQ